MIRARCELTLPGTRTGIVETKGMKDRVVPIGDPDPPVTIAGPGVLRSVVGWECVIGEGLNPVAAIPDPLHRGQRAQHGYEE